MNTEVKWLKLYDILTNSSVTDTRGCAWHSDELLRYWYMGVRLSGGAVESQNRRNSANRPEKFNVYDHRGYEL
jgi:hypothetical protein